MSRESTTQVIEQLVTRTGGGREIFVLWVDVGTLGEVNCFKNAQIASGVVGSEEWARVIGLRKFGMLAR